MTQRVSAIAAISENRVLGNKGKIPWHIPEDMKFFKERTMGHALIMGRKTFAAMGKPLPGRLNIVLSHDPTKNENTDNCFFTTSLEDALNYARDWEKKNDKPEIFIVGGGEIYKLALPCTDRLYLTIVEGNYDGDAFFPDYSEFKKVISEESRQDEKYKYKFLTLER